MATKKKQKTHGVTVMKPEAKEIAKLQVINPDVSYTDGIPTQEPLQDLSDAYRVHSWVYTAAWTVASNLAGLEWQAYRLNKENLWEEYTKHELLPLLQRPNPYMTAYQLREFTYLSLSLTGNAYWIFERNARGLISQIWTVPAGAMRIVTTKDKFIDHFVYDVNGKTIRFEYNEVLHFKYTDPNDMIYGQGSLTASKLAVMQDLYAQAWNKYFFKNSGRPDSALSTDQTLSQDVRDRVKKAWESMHSGPQNNAKLAIFEAGLKFSEINRTPKDMDFTSLRNLSREEILSAFGVPPIMAGVLDETNYNTAREQKKIFWERTLIPLKKSVDEVLTLRAAQLFFDPFTHFEADTSDVEALRADMNMLSTTAKNFVSIGIPLNEVIDKLNLPFDPVEGGDVPMAFGPALANDPASSTPTDPNAPPPPRSFEKVKKEVKIRTLEAAWKSFDSRSRDHELDMAVSLRGYFGGQRRRVLAKLEREMDRLLEGHVSKQAIINLQLIFNTADEKKRMHEAIDKHISGTYYDFAVSTSRGLTGGSFNLENPKAVDFIRRKQIKLVNEATDYTLERLDASVRDGIREAVEEGLKRGDAISRIAERIDDFYEFSRESRSTRIARTETISSANGGSYQAMKDAGVEKKAWLSSRDEKVRDTHQSLEESEPIGINEAFVSDSGATLAFPGDPSAPADEICNCRCKVLAILDDQRVVS